MFMLFQCTEHPIDKGDVNIDATWDNYEIRNSARNFNIDDDNESGQHEGDGGWINSLPMTIWFR